MSTQFRPPSQPIGLEILPPEVIPDVLPERDRKPPSRISYIIRNRHFRIGGGIIAGLVLVIIAVVVGVKISEKQRPTPTIPHPTVSITTTKSIAHSITRPPRTSKNTTFTTSASLTSLPKFSLCLGGPVTEDSGEVAWVCSTSVSKSTVRCPGGDLSHPKCNGAGNMKGPIYRDVAN